jgi:hypothetical protein
MPALTAIIGANATQYKAVMGEVAAISERSAAATLAAFKTVETQLKAQMLTVDTATTQWEMYAASLASVQAAMTRTSVALTMGGTLPALSTVFAAAPNLSAEEKYIGEYKRLLEEKDAAIKASRVANIATALSVASMGGMASSFGAGGGPGGGLSGIMREVFVIGREFLKGNWSRIPGSVVLLAQYMGVLGVMIKSTAQAAIFHAAAENKLSASMANTFLAANAKAQASMTAAEAENFDNAAANALAEANEREAATAEMAMLAQNEKALAATNAAKVESAGAITSIGLWGYVAAAVIMVGVAAYLTWRHFRALAVEARNLANLMNPLKTSMKSATDAELEAAKAHQEYLDKMKKISSETESFIEIIDKEIKAFSALSKAQQELARARGASGVEIERMEEAELAAELEMLKAAKANAEVKRDEAKASADAAQAAVDQFDVVDMTQKKGVAENAGQVLEAVQLAAQTGNTGVWLDFFKKIQTEGGGDKPISTLEPAFKNADFFKGIGLTGTETVNQAVQNFPISGAKVGGQELPTMTIGAAEAAYKSAETEAINLERQYKGLGDATSEAVDVYKKANGEVLKFGDQVDETAQELGIKQKYGREIAALQKGGGGGRTEATARERVGVGAPQVALLNVAQQQLSATRETNRILQIHALTRETAVHRGESVRGEVIF